MEHMLSTYSTLNAFLLTNHSPKYN